jgi:hypothetical protein
MRAGVLSVRVSLEQGDGNQGAEKAKKNPAEAGFKSREETPMIRQGEASKSRLISNSQIRDSHR